MFERYKLEKRLKALIAKAGTFGLPQKDQDFANEFVEYNEPALALDQVAVQLYEFDIKIDQACYDEIMQIATLLATPEGDYTYLNDLIAL
ncbi:MAG: MafI family immunity protein [Bacteroidota bacterium]